jgi:hypothetical protein
LESHLECSEHTTFRTLAMAQMRLQVAFYSSSGDDWILIVQRCSIELVHRKAVDLQCLTQMCIGVFAGCLFASLICTGTSSHQSSHLVGLKHQGLSGSTLL